MSPLLPSVSLPIPFSLRMTDRYPLSPPRNPDAIKTVSLCTLPSPQPDPPPLGFPEPSLSCPEACIPARKALATTQLPPASTAHVPYDPVTSSS